MCFVIRVSGFGVLIACFVFSCFLFFLVPVCGFRVSGFRLGVLFRLLVEGRGNLGHAERDGGLAATGRAHLHHPEPDPENLPETGKGTIQKRVRVRFI